MLYPPPGMIVLLRIYSFLPEMDQVIHAAGVSSLIASVLVVVYMLFRFVRGQMNTVPWHSTTYAEMTSHIPHSNAWKTLKAQPPKLQQRAPHKNAVYSDSEDSD